MLGPFIWGKNGQKLTPEQVDRMRAQSAAMLQGVGDTSPVGHWLQGAGRIANAIAGKIVEGRADRKEEAGMAGADAYIQSNPVLSALIGGGGVPSVSLSSAGSAPQTDAQRVAGETMAALGMGGETQASLINTESGGNWAARNSEVGAGGQVGHFGRVQFGRARFAEAQAAGAVPPGMTIEQFASDTPEGRAAQVSAEKWHFGDLEAKLSDLVGRTVNGQVMDMNALKAMGHLGGAGGARKYVESGGAYNPSDSFGTSLSDYAKTHGGGGVSMSSAGGASQQSPIAAPLGGNVTAALTAAMSDPWVAKKYGPVLNSLMGRQMSREDMQYQEQLKQSDPMYQAQLAALTAPQPVDPWAGTKEINGQIVRMGPNGPETVFDGRAPDVLFANLTPQEVASLGLPAGAYQRGPNGEIKQIGGGGVTVNNDMSGGGKFEEAFAKGDAATVETVYNSGLAAQRNLGRIDQLEGLLGSSPTGMGAALAQAAGEWGINTEGLDSVQAAQSIINSLVPEQRQPGSGPMSDADLALFKQSLPRIINQPGGNKTIIDTMRAIAQYDAEGASIVQRMRLPAGDPNRLTRDQAFAALQARANPLSNAIGAGAQTGAQPTTTGLSDDDLKYLEQP